MTDTGLAEYKSLFKISYIVTILMLIIIPIQIIVFFLTKIPSSTIEWFSLFDSNIVLGFFHADLFILLNNLFIAIIYLSFYHLLKHTNKGLLQVGIVLGLLGIAAYISSNKTFELLALSRQYFSVDTVEAKGIIEAAGLSLLREWQGTAFDSYYVLNGITLLIVSILMYKSTIFNKVTAIWGLISAVLMTVPSTAGMIGMIFSLLSLVPWYVFSIRFLKIFKEYSR